VRKVRFAGKVKAAEAVSPEKWKPPKVRFSNESRGWLPEESQSQGFMQAPCAASNELSEIIVFLSQG
jgi:hypothetical protein